MSSVDPSDSNESPRGLPRWLAALLAALLAIIVGHGTLEGGFVLDDQTYVVRNPSVTGDAAWLTAPTPPDRPELGLYRPLTILTYRLQHRIVGLDPGAFRAFNLILHALATALVVLAALRLGAGLGVAFAAGATFACHPVHVEAVAWIVGRAEVLATAFALLALVARPRGDEPRAFTREVAMASCYGLAALAKESALALPAALVALDWIERVPRRVMVRRIALLAATAALLILARLAILGRFAPEVSDHPTLAGLGFTERCELALRVYSLALEHLLVPLDLSIYYEPRVVGGWLRLASGIVALGITLLVVVRSRHAVMRGSLAFLLAGLLPFLHLVPLGWLFGDRFLYLASCGFVVAACQALSGALRKYFAVGVGIVTLAFAALTLQRTPVYSSDLALWRDAVAADPSSGFAHFQLAGLLEDAGKLEYTSEAEKGAVHHWTESLRVEPDHLFAVRAHVELGEYAQAKLRDPLSARAHYRAAAALDPETRSSDCVDALIDFAGLHVPATSTGEIVTAEEAIAATARAARARLTERQRALLLRLVEGFASRGQLPAAGDASESSLRAALEG